MASQQALYDKIDALNATDSKEEHIRKLKQILNDLAYYAATGDGAVMEAREEWHTTFTDRLYEASGADHAAAVAAAAAKKASASSSALPSAAGKGSPSEKKAKPRHDIHKGVRGTGSKPAVRELDEDEERLPQAPPGNRPRPEAELPASLRAIMNGSHPSFKEDDYYEVPVASSKKSSS